MNESHDKAPETVAPARDWLALLSQAEVVGPLSDDELRACLADGQIPASARLFHFQSGPDAVDRSASLAADNARLADSLRAAEAEVNRLQADVKARDMEFEGERQQMAADVSKLRAEGVRKDARIETLEKSAALLADAQSARADAERKLRACELDVARLSAEASDAATVRTEAETQRQRNRALQNALDAALAKLRDQATRLSDLAGSLSAIAADSAAVDIAPPPEATESAPAPDPAAPSPDRRTAIRPFPAGKPQTQDAVQPIIERVTPTVDAASSPRNAPRAPDARLAQLEARAREELAMLGERGGTTPRWARRKS